jgi:hypothetical protein
MLSPAGSGKKGYSKNEQREQERDGTKIMEYLSKKG